MTSNLVTYYTRGHVDIQVIPVVGINLGSVYLRRDDAARGANLQHHYYSWWPSCTRSNLKGATCCW